MSLCDEKDEAMVCQILCRARVAHWGASDRTNFRLMFLWRKGTYPGTCCCCLGRLNGIKATEHALSNFLDCTYDQDTKEVVTGAFPLEAL